MATRRPGPGVILGVLALALIAWAGFILWGLPALLVLLVLSIALTPLAPEVVTLLGIAVLYLNLPGIAVTVHNQPVAVAASTWLALVAPFLVLVLFRRKPVIVDAPLLLMLAFLGVVLLSCFSAEDYGAATRWITTFLTEGLLTYFLIVNLFRSRESLRRGITVMVLCGALLGGLTLYQEVTQSYTQQFAGLARRNIEYGTGEEQVKEKDRLRRAHQIHLRERSSGPLGDPNRYAQILIVLLPFAYFLMRTQKAILAKITSAMSGALILAGALLTYSRGGFIGITAQLVLLKSMGSVRWKELGLFVLAAAIAVTVWAPGYVLRLETMGGLSGAVRQTRGDNSDEVIAGRLTEMLAALNVFLDHPVLGVGPGQFLPVYSTTYMSNPDIALRRITERRRAHTLYFELAAEAGILGLLTFFGAVGLVQVRLWKAWRRWKRRNQPELAALAAAFFLAIVGYLVTGIFLHLAFQRYYWLLLGMAGAALQVMADEDWRFLHGNGAASSRGNAVSPTAPRGKPAPPRPEPIRPRTRRPSPIESGSPAGGAD